ncbi:transcription-repair coupling factor [bacterium]|nr:transcription-repair coupling factor [bacterium]
MSDSNAATKYVSALRTLLSQAEGYDEFLKTAFAAKYSKLSGIIPPARPYFAASLLEHSNAPLLWITSTSQRAEQLYQDMQPLLGDDWQVLIFPALNDYSPDHSAWRLQVLQALNELGDMTKDLSWADPNSAAFRQSGLPVPKLMIIAPIAALFLPTLSEERLQKSKLELRVGDTVDMSSLVELLCSEGYERVALTEKRGDIAVRGGILDIYPLTGEPVRLEFDDDAIEAMRCFDIDTQCSVRKAERVVLMPATECIDDPQQQAYFPDILRSVFPDALICVEDRDLVQQEASEFMTEWSGDEDAASYILDDNENKAIVEHVNRLLESFRQIDVSSWAGDSDGSEYNYDVPFSAAPVLERSVEELLELLPLWQKENSRTIIITRQAKRLFELMSEHDVYNVRFGDSSDMAQYELKRGQIWLINEYQAQGWELQLSDGRLRLITDHEITGQRRLRHSAQQDGRRRQSVNLDELKVGDYVVHIDYGIGRYDGVVNSSFQGINRDMLRVVYEDGSVFITAESIDKLQKYHALKDAAPALSRLKGKKWTQAKTKALNSIHDVAEDLLRIAALRKKAEGHVYSTDSPWFRDFVQAFPYKETPDQQKAIDDVFADLRRNRPMDRLICGDVGFGKTEVALRAAFGVATESRQVAVLAPTTVLAQQHYQTFKERMAAFPVHIELLSRVKTPREQKSILERLEAGNVDIVIGTHRLLSKDVHFKALGLIVVDEEHRFGVTAKERLKELRSNVEVLTMSATPIPRTLQMSMYGIRDFSLIETPPAERLPIKTFLRRRDNDIIRHSIMRELQRQGQVFYLHNRINDIDLEYNRLQKLVPQARIRVAHGQMNARQLEQIMLGFYEGEFDVLISTTIIENGLDIPNVNTIIVDNAHMFGLAQLYQLRGRVGRSTTQAYCYLMVPPSGKINEQAVTRLETLRDFTRLGDGYRIARRDMELRGAGDILGTRQAGHVTAVGFELYCQMLRETLDELSAKEAAKPVKPSKDTTKVDRIPVSTGIPNSYISDAAQKVSFYKRIACASLQELGAIEKEMWDRYGKLPEETQNLFSLVTIKRKGTALCIMEVEVSYGSLYLYMPLANLLGIKKFLTYAQKRELNEASKLEASSEGWLPHWDEKDKVLFFTGLFGRAAGNTEYPPAQDMLFCIESILDVLAGWQKALSAG